MLTQFVPDEKKITSIANSIVTIQSFLNNLCKRVKESEEYSSIVHKCLTFLCEQLTSQTRYSSDTLAFNFHLNCMSQSVYNIVHDKSLLLLRVSYLCKLSTAFSMSSDSLDDNIHVAYLKSKCNILEGHQQVVVLYQDEIHVNGERT